MQLLSWMKTAALPISTLAITAGMSADFHEVLTAASLPYPLLVTAARSCLESLPLSVDKTLRIKAAHSLSAAMQCIWPDSRRYEAKGDLLPLKQAIAEAQDASMDPDAIVKMQLTLATMCCSITYPKPTDYFGDYVNKDMQHVEIFEPVYR